jgi:hypothetical protein
MFNINFGLPRTGKNSARSLDTIQSGLPDVASLRPFAPSPLRPFAPSPTRRYPFAVTPPGSFPLNSPPLHAIVCLLD